MNSKAAQDRQQRILLDLVRQPGNDVCADCKGRAPRWASWNLGIFICVQCAGVHRKMGVHISKVKSITLDTWTREQVDRMKEVGNLKSNRKYNPDEMRNRPPTNMEESERDSELEKYIRRKYEFRRFVEGRPPPVPSKDATFLTSPSGSVEYSHAPRSPVEPISSSQSSSSLAQGSSIARSRTAPIPSTWSEAQQRVKANAPPLPNPTAAGYRAASGSQINGTSALSTRSTALTQSSLQLPGASVPLRTTSALNTRDGGQIASASKPTTPTVQSSVFDDLISLNESSQPTATQPPLQMNPWASLQAQQQAVLSAPAIQEPTGLFWAGQPSPNGVASPMAPFGISPSNNNMTFDPVRNTPQHANTMPSLSVSSAQNPLSSQATGMLSASNGGMYSQFEQQRSVGLGSMAFSTSPLPSPGFAPSNPFNATQSNSAAPLPQTAGFVGVNSLFQHQPQQLGQVAFQGQANILAPNQAF